MPFAVGWPLTVANGVAFVAEGGNTGGGGSGEASCCKASGVYGIREYRTGLPSRALRANKGISAYLGRLRAGGGDAEEVAIEL